MPQLSRVVLESHSYLLKSIPRGVYPLSSSDTVLRTSNTLFVLGSSWDINRLSDEQWSVIADNDSIAFNSWVRHSFIPSFYLIHYLTPELLTLFQDRKYDKTIFLVRGSSFGQRTTDLRLLEDVLSFAQSRQLRTLVELPVGRAFEELSPSDAVRFLSAVGILTHGSASRVVPKFRGTLGMAVAFGYLMGYKEIVICGSNPRSPGHFWDKHRDNRRLGLKSPIKYFTSGLWTLESEWYMKNSQTSYISAIHQLMAVDRVGGVFSGSAVAADFGLTNYWSMSGAVGVDGSSA